MSINSIPPDRAVAVRQQIAGAAKGRTQQVDPSPQTSAGEKTKSLSKEPIVDRVQVAAAARELAREMTDKPHLMLSPERLSTLASGEDNSL